MAVVDALEVEAEPVVDGGEVVGEVEGEVVLLGEAEGLVGDQRGYGDQPGADARALKKTVTAALDSIGRRPAA